MSTEKDPIAAYLDAVTEAQHQGVTEADVRRLHDIADLIVDFSFSLSASFARLKSGAMASPVAAEVADQPPGPFEFDDPADFARFVTLCFEEDTTGYGLDALPVIQSAVELSLCRPAVAKAA